MTDIDKINQAIFDLGLGTRALTIINELYQVHRISHKEYCSFKGRILGENILRKDMGYLETKFPTQSALTPKGEAYGKAVAGTAQTVGCRICGKHSIPTFDGLCHQCDLGQADHERE